MKHLTFSLMAGFSAVVMSCAPVRPHHSTLSQAGVRGQLVDARNGAPIANHRVQVTVNGDSIARTTTPQGKWRIPAAKLRNGTHFTEANIQIDCSGYEHQQIHWTRATALNRKSAEAGIINLGTIRLKKS